MEPPRLEPPRRFHPRPLVLLVDDHDDTRAMYAYALTAMGFDMMVAEDGAHAQARASKARPDIIVMDVALRGNDGWTLLRDLKGDSRTREIPVVVITGYAAPSVRERAQREGCAAFCVKPFPPDALALRLRALLDRNVAHAG